MIYLLISLIKNVFWTIYKGRDLLDYWGFDSSDLKQQIKSCRLRISKIFKKKRKTSIGQ